MYGHMLFKHLFCVVVGGCEECVAGLLRLPAECFKIAVYCRFATCNSSFV